MKHSQSVELQETIKRWIANMQMAIVCIALPVLFIIGIKGNDQRPSGQSAHYEKVSKSSQSGEAMIEYNSRGMEKNS